MAIKLSQNEKDLKKIVDAIRALLEGHSNNVVTATLTPNATTTTVASETCSSTSAVLPQPTTAHAANDMGLLSIVAGSKQFVVSHANNARVDRTFNFIVVG